MSKSLTNKEKEEIVSLQRIPNNCFCTSTEIMRKKKLFHRCPTILYKYRDFDEHRENMFKENYAYCSPLKDLDDPFDCLILEEKDIDLISDKDLKEKFTNLFVKHTHDKFHFLITLKNYKFVVRKILNNTLNFEEACLLVTTKCCVDDNTAQKVVNSINVSFANFENNISIIKDYYRYIEETVRRKNKIGVLSLSEIKDNKLLWSLYANNYQGYCIEYELPKSNSNIYKRTFPIIYKRNNSNRLLEKILLEEIGTYERLIDSFGLYKNVNLGAIASLFVTKDIEWRFQKEWRIFGSAQEHITELKIKAIYLGYKVTDLNRRLVENYAKSAEFAIFLMDDPKKVNKISFKRVY